MEPARWAALALALSFVANSSLAEPREPPATYSVGFELITSADAARPVGGHDGAPLQPRPIRAYLWYPASRSDSKARPMTFGRFAALANDDVWPAEIADGVRGALQYSHGPLARSLDGSAYEALLREPTLAAENARPARGRFPLILIAGGVYYELPIAFAATAEHLAARGFAVAATPLVGAHSAITKVDGEDVEAQVRDLEALIGIARERPFVSLDTVGVLGFDQGGMVGVLLTMRNRDVDAFMSMDSGVLFPHPSGLPRSSQSYDPLALRVPWFHATGPQAANAPAAVGTDLGVVLALGLSEASSLFVSAAHAERFLMLVEGMGHVDYTGYGLVENRGAVAGYWQAGSPSRAAGYRAVRSYAANFFAAFLRSDAESRAFLARAPEPPAPGVRMLLEHRDARPAAITYDSFVDAVITGHGADAIRELRLVASAEPNHPLLQRATLERLVTILLFTWGLGEETLPVIDFLGERFPDAPSATSFRAEAFVLAGRDADAITAYERHLERFPNDAGAKGRIAELRAKR